MLVPDDLITTAEAAEIIGRSVSSISRLVDKGLLVPARRIGGGPGGSMLFARSEIETFAAERAS